MNYHAEVINLSLRNKKILANYTIQSVRKRFLGLLKIYTITVPADSVDDVITSFQKNMSTKLNKEWYITFHTNEDAIIVFRQKIFPLDTKDIQPVFQQQIDVSGMEDNLEWKNMISYAKSIGVPDNQCDFLPLDFRDQDYSN